MHYDSRWFRDRTLGEQAIVDRMYELHDAHYYIDRAVQRIATTCLLVCLWATVNMSFTNFKWVDGGLQFFAAGILWPLVATLAWLIGFGLLQGLIFMCKWLVGIEDF